MIENIFVVGGVVGFFLYLWFNADISWIVKFKVWWEAVTAKNLAGKPFVCPFCMSFWSALPIGIALSQYEGFDWIGLFWIVPAGSITGLLIIKMIERLDTIIL